MRGREEAGLTSNRINKVVELSLEDIQGVAQHLVVVGFALGNKVQLLLHCAADGGEHQLCICEQVGGVAVGTQDSAAPRGKNCCPAQPSSDPVFLGCWSTELEGTKGSSYCYQTFPQLPIMKVCVEIFCRMARSMMYFSISHRAQGTLVGRVGRYLSEEPKVCTLGPITMCSSIKCLSPAAVGIGECMKSTGSLQEAAEPQHRKEQETPQATVVGRQTHQSCSNRAPELCRGWWA